MRCRAGLVLVFLLCGTIPDARAQSKSDATDALVEIFMREERVVGIAVAAMKNGQIIHARGYGVASLEHVVPVTERTVFRIASLSKQFTAMGVLILVEEGRVDLEAGIRAYFPEYPAASPNPTVRQLLNHTSALDFEAAWTASSPPSTTNPSEMRDPKGFAELFARTTFASEPGTRFRYNNNAYAMLGLLIERVSGASYATFLTRRIFEPLGLTQTMYVDTSSIIKHRAGGHTLRGETIANAPPSSLNTTFAAGALGSTVLDLLAWRRALIGHRLVSAGTMKAMTTPGRLSDGTPIPYGLGLFLLEMDGHVKVDHYGNTTGFRAELAYYPAQDLTVVVLANTNPARTDVLESRISRLLMGVAEVQVTELPLTRDALAQYAGRFMVSDAPISHRSMLTEVVLRDQGLYVGRFRLRAIGGNVFVAEGDPYHHYTFTVRGGRAIALRVEREGRLIVDARRVD